MTIPSVPSHVTSEQYRRSKMTAAEIALSKNKKHWRAIALKKGLIAALLELAKVEKRPLAQIQKHVKKKTGPKYWKCPEVAKRRNRIVQAVKKNPGARRVEICEATGIPAADVSRDMVALMEEGRVHHFVEKRIAFYYSGPKAEAAE